MHEDFNYGQVKRPNGLRTLEGFVSNQDGWYLPPSTRGELIYRVPRTPGAHMAAALWIYMAAPSITGQLRIAAGPSEVTLSGPSYTGQVVELPDFEGDS